jgi:hypothetical protein
LLGGIIGLVAAGTLFASVAAAHAPTPVTVAVNAASAVNSLILSSTRTITVDVTWAATEPNGTAANLQILQSDGNSPT